MDTSLKMSKEEFQTPRLILKGYDECRYCEKRKNIRSKLVSARTGILYCEHHEEQAEQDCWLYMKIFGMIYIPRHQIPSVLLHHPFAIENTAVCKSWRLALGKVNSDIPLRTQFRKNHGNEWMFPMWQFLQQPDETFMEYFPISLLIHSNPEIGKELRDFETWLENRFVGALSYGELV